MDINRYKYLIVGGGVAGTTAAESIRPRNPAGTIAVVSDEPFGLYSRVMLSKPNFFLGKIPFDEVWLKGGEWYEKNNIAFLGGKKAIGIDARNKIVSLADGSQISYEKLLLATGVCARHLEVPGADKKGIYYLRMLQDGKAIMNAIKSAKRAAIVGGGFIGFEMAELLKMAGLDTTIIIRESYFWEPALDEDSGRIIEKAIKDNGVKIIYKAEVAEIVGNASIEAVVLKNSERIECDMIICGIGAACVLDWIKNSGLKTSRGILTNEYLETNLPDVWAAGDVAEFKDLILDETIQLGNWVNAHEQGRIAGLNMAGSKEPFKFVSFYTTSGFGLSIAFVGDVRLGPDRIVIKRGSPRPERGKPEINSYARIIVLDKGNRKEVEGATLINRTSEMSAIAKLIESNIDVSEKLSKLGDANFELKRMQVIG